MDGAARRDHMRRRRSMHTRVLVGLGLLACGAAFAPPVSTPLAAARQRAAAAAATTETIERRPRRTVPRRQQTDEAQQRKQPVLGNAAIPSTSWDSERPTSQGRKAARMAGKQGHFDETPDLLTAQDEIKLGKLVQKRIGWDGERTKLEAALGRPPSLEEWSQACGLDGGAEGMRRRVARTDAAKERMVSANLRLVMSIARRYKFSVQSKLPLGDLIQEGTFGLVKAVERFDPDKGFRFSTYASWWVRQTVMRAIAEQSRTIRLPSHVHDLLHHIRRAGRELQAELGRPATLSELAGRMDMAEERLSYYMEKDRAEPVSLSTTVGGASASKPGGGGGSSGGGGTSLTIGERVTDAGQSPQDFTEKRLLQDDVERLLWKLSPRERAVLRMRYGLDDGRAMTLKQVGERFNVTRERIRQIEARALHKLRQPFISCSVRQHSVEVL
ncbi:unnamed protein product [Phaeothamnion confervicola]